MELNDYRMVRMIRKLRNLTLIQMGEVMGVSDKTLSKIESGHILFSPLYQTRFKEACIKLNVSNVELSTCRFLLELQDGEK